MKFKTKRDDQRSSEEVLGELLARKLAQCRTIEDVAGLADWSNRNDWNNGITRLDRNLMLNPELYDRIVNWSF